MQQILDDAGLPSGLNPDSEARVPTGTALRLWAAAVARTADADFGLHLAELLDRMWPPPVPVRDVLVSLRYAVCSGGTVRDMFERLERYWRIVSDTTEVTIEATEGEIAICHRPTRDGFFNRHVAEMTLATWCHWLRRVTPEWLPPVAIRFAHARPRNTATHQRVFGAPLRFSAGCDAIAVHPMVAALPVRADQPIFPLDPPPDDLLWRVPVNGLVSRARAAMAGELSGGGVTAARVAGRLRMSTRNYCRLLERYGTSHGRILAALRHEYAVRWLFDGQVTADQVASRLGFADYRGFARALRRWTGLTPTAYRQTCRDPGERLVAGPTAARGRLP